VKSLVGSSIAIELLAQVAPHALRYTHCTPRPALCTCTPSPTLFCTHGIPSPSLFYTHGIPSPTLFYTHGIPSPTLFYTQSHSIFNSNKRYIYTWHPKPFSILYTWRPPPCTIHTTLHAPHCTNDTPSPAVHPLHPDLTP
jgi:hypothetical protein